MKSPTEWTSPSTPWNLASSFGSGERLKPVLTGSMKTRSVRSNSVFSLSTSRYGGGGASPSSARATHFGPKAPKCSHTDDEPGPPLNAKVIGRCAGSSTPVFVYATKKTLAVTLPSSSLSGSVPAVAL